jgi:hypothetical protein
VKWFAASRYSVCIIKIQIDMLTNTLNGKVQGFIMSSERPAMLSAMWVWYHGNTLLDIPWGL